MAVRRTALASWLAAVAVFTWALWLRVDGVSSDFWLMQDQVGDWQTVQGGFGSLPLTGPAKTGGGTHLGPYYYWWLWLSRRALSPWTGPLPHAMGVAGGLLDACAFALLVPAIASTGAPLVATAGAVLLAATVPYEAALARAGWNPCFALACLVLSLSLLLLARRRVTPARAALVAALAWAAVASHLSAIVVALPLLAGAVAAAIARAPRRAATVVATVAVVVVAMQLPWLLARRGLGPRVWAPGDRTDAVAASPPDADEAGPAGAVDPARRGVDPGEATTAVTRTLDAIGSAPSRLLATRGLSFVALETPALFLRSLPLPRALSGGLLAAAVLLVVSGSLRRRVEPLAAALALSPLAVAAVACTALDGELRTYFAIPLLGPLALLAALAIGSLPPRAAAIGGAALLAVAVLGQPHRLEDRRWEHSYRWYGTVVRGSREVAARGTVVRAVEGPVERSMPTSTTALARWLGARIDPGSKTVARIGRDGSVGWIEEP